MKATLVLALALAIYWTTGAIIYRYVWGRWLHGWAWPFAIAFCLVGRRAQRWERTDP